MRSAIENRAFHRACYDHGMRLLALLLLTVLLIPGCKDRTDNRYRNDKEMTRFQVGGVSISGSPISYRFDLSSRELVKASGTASLVCTTCVVGDGGKLGGAVSSIGEFTIPALARIRHQIGERGP